MTQIPAGWYPDPDPAQSLPDVQRYWDGQQWTEHVHAPAGPPPAGQVPTYPAQAAAEQQPTYPDQRAAGQSPAYPVQASTYPAQVDPAQGSSAQGSGGYAQAPGGPATTPDGQQLASWWSRVGAYLLDSLIVKPIVVLLALPWVRQIVSSFGDLMSEAMRAAEAGDVGPDPAAMMTDLAVPFLIFTLIGLAVNFVYHVGFLKWKAATPGKLVVGLRVRLRETPGPLSWGTVLLRWLGQFGYGLLGFIPVLGSILSIYPVVDSLWPLWDAKKQALHDKVAKTNVVRRRR